MTCFNCGKLGQKTGHERCRNPTTSNEAGKKAKDAYRKKLLEKKKKKTSHMSNIEADSSESDSDSDDASDMCMMTSWETDDDATPEGVPEDCFNNDDTDEDTTAQLLT